MKQLLVFIISFFSIGVASVSGGELVQPKNEAVLNYNFLAEMYQDTYFPNKLVDKGKRILLTLCSEIEAEKPKSNDDVYVLTHKATVAFNVLAMEFDENGSEIETAAREAIATDISFILATYGFKADLEEAIAPRDW